MEKKVIFRSGLSFGTVFFIVLFILKVCKVGIVANWSWWIITLPLWGGVALYLLIILITMLIGFIAIILEKK